MKRRFFFDPQFSFTKDWWTFGANFGFGTWHYGVKTIFIDLDIGPFHFFVAFTRESIWTKEELDKAKIGAEMIKNWLEEEEQKNEM